MTKTEKQEIADAINEALYEIRRLNEARGETVFNPTATSGLRYALAKLISE